MFRTAYGERERVQLVCGDESRTHQSFKEECDINGILAKWRKTGVLGHANRYQGDYGDFINGPQDYHAACNQVLAAEAAFSSLPAHVRKRFGNDPAEFLGFVANNDNEAEMRAMGLLKPEVPEVVPVPVGGEVSGAGS